MSTAAVTSTLFRYLPRGGSLPEAVWQKRHRAMVVLLWLHVPALFAVGVATGHDWLHVALECSILVAFGVVGMSDHLHRNLRMVATSLGLLTASALLVHFSGGVIEMHFHFFVIVAAVTLYQAWLPFLTAIAYVVGQHGVMGVLDAASVYNHPAAVASPWRWAFVHGFFILGECVTLLVAWRLNEDSRAAAEAEYESRLKEEKARRAAQDAYGRIFENSMEGIYETTAAGYVMTANPALARILGYGSAEEMTGQPIARHYMHPEERLSFLSMLDEQGSVLGYEFEARRVDGSSVWLSNNATALRDEMGRLISVQGMVEDISKRKEVELKKEDLEAQLRQAQKMDAVGQLAGGVAHDFNNLLSIIQNYARFSLDGLDSTDLRAQDLQEVLKASKRGSDLVRQLIAFSRKEVVVGTALDLNEIVRELGRMLHRTLGEDIALRTELGSDLWSVEADEGHLEQILMNLVLNARDALTTNGEVTIDTSNHVLEPDEAMGAVMEPGRYVLLRVSDNGCGMTDDVKERIFEPFFTTKEVGAGSGLGLATVYGIVEHWKGHINVKSELGAGTEFLIYLPATSQTADAVESAAAPLFDADASGRILVVEDETSVLELSRRILTAHGFEVETARSAEEALAKLSADERIDLCLSDMVMPEVSGRQFADLLAKSHPGLPIVFMSGYSDDVFSKHGAVEPEKVLLKPFSPEQLVAHVQKGLRQNLSRA